MMQHESLRVLIVDDEPLARERIRKILRTHPEVEMVAECKSGSEAVAAVQEHSPDLMFLDVQIPEMDGFTVLEHVDQKQMPNVIFVTAYDRYALRAFEVHAMDYLLKPFDRDRFEEAFHRAKDQIQRNRQNNISRNLSSLLQHMKSQHQYLERLAVKSAGRVFFLKIRDIDWIEAEGNYVRLHVGKQSHLIRQAIGNMEEQLDPEKFIRVHRSTIINIDRIRELQPWFHGDYRVYLQDGTELLMSRSYKDKFRHLLGKS